ncbi:MAG: tetratricopeptide repeat protein [Bacteroidia bacterium]
MKHALLFITGFSLFLTVSAQNKRFTASMEKNIKMMDTCKSAPSYQQVANGFERIANAEKKEWLPSYYASLCHVFMATSMTGDKIDEYCDIAERFATKADSLSPNNSEIYALKALIYSSRIGVNPMLRGAKFGGMSGEASAKAKELDPSNPRPYLLQAQGKYYTPPQFGGGKDKALPLFEEAVKKYDAFKLISPINPNWGKERAKMLLEECQKK